MCEIFGAYGWAEGLPMMKYLADHMLVNGVNQFVPHAFSPKFPDTDCPPHFYAKGNNPQHINFKYLMKYMKRISYILSGGTHKADVLVLYNAEGEWTGGEYEYYSKIAKILTQNQIDFDFVPCDIFANDEFSIDNDALKINNESYKALIVSYSEIFPEKIYRKFEEISAKWDNIYFIDKLPSHFENGKETSSSPLKELKKENMIEFLREKYNLRPMLDKAYPYLRFYHTEDDENNVFMFFNESINQKFCAELNLGISGEYVLYNPWDNTACKGKTTDGMITLNLDCTETAIIIFTQKEEKSFPERKEYIFEEICDIKYDIYTKSSADEDYVLYKKDTKAININAKDEIPDFCGFIRYEAEFDADAEFKFIEFDYIGEAGHLYINDIDCGCCISKPYRYCVADALKNGKNKLILDVTTNRAYKEKDRLSKYLLLQPTGVVGSVRLYAEKQD